MTNTIRNTKKAYFNNKVQENRHNPRKLWNLIRCLSDDDAGQNHGIQRLIVDDGNVTDKMTIAETLSCFFTNQQSYLISTTGSPTDQKKDLDPSLLHENATLNFPIYQRQGFLNFFYRFQRTRPQEMMG